MIDLERHDEILKIKRYIKQLVKNSGLQLYQQEFILSSLLAEVIEKRYHYKMSKYYKDSTIQKLMQKSDD